MQEAFDTNDKLPRILKAFIQDLNECVTSELPPCENIPNKFSDWDQLYETYVPLMKKELQEGLKSAMARFTPTDDPKNIVRMHFDYRMACLAIKNMTKLKETGNLREHTLWILHRKRYASKKFNWNQVVIMACESGSWELHHLIPSGKKLLDGDTEMYATLLTDVTTIYRIQHTLRLKRPLRLKALVGKLAKTRREYDDPRLHEDLMHTMWNFSQRDAIHNICKQIIPHKMSKIHMINGPPGTGKTTTLLGIISYLARNHTTLKMNTLITSSCNSTITHLTLNILKCIPNPPFILVVGHSSRVDPRLHFLLLETWHQKYEALLIRLRTVICYSSKPTDCQTEQDRKYVQDQCQSLSLDFRRLPVEPFLGQTKNVAEKKVSALLDIISTSFLVQEDLHHQLMSEFGFEEGMATDDLKTTIGYLKDILKVWDSKYIDAVLLNKAVFVLSTLCVSMSPMLRTTPFRIVIVDEAAQALFPEVLNCLRRETSHLILAGDPKQSPALVTSLNARAAGLSRSMMVMLIEYVKHKYYFLNEQNRMHPDIAMYPARCIYQNRLQSGVKTEGHVINDIQPYQVIGMTKSTERREGAGSYYNLQEIAWIRNWIVTHKEVEPSQITVITPYVMQFQKLMEQLSIFEGITIATVDSYQGKENDVVILSLVRADGNFGFVNDLQRLNVALTRARKVEIIVCNEKTAMASSVLKPLIKDAQDRGYYERV